MRTPEDLSGFFESFCATTNVTSDDPLMDLYGTMTSDAGAMLFEIAASPDNDTMAAAQMSSADILAVCRPTDSRDLDVFTYVPESQYEAISSSALVYVFVRMVVPVPERLPANQMSKSNTGLFI